MRNVAALLSALSILLAAGPAGIPATSAADRAPGLPSITLPSRGPRLEWSLHPSVPLQGPNANQMRLRVYSSLKNIPSGLYLSVQNGALIMGSSQAMEFQFEADPTDSRLLYSVPVAIKSRSGQYLRATISGGTPVVVLSSIPSREWLILGGVGGRPVPVDAPVALTNAVARQGGRDDLVYCPGTLGGLELSWGSRCPPPPSAAGEQPVDIARRTPLVPPGVRFPVEFQWAIDAYSPSTRHAVLRNTRVEKILRTHLPNEPLLGISDQWVFVDQLGAGLSIFVDSDGTTTRLPYLLYNVRYAIRYRISDSLCGPSLSAPCHYHVKVGPSGFAAISVPPAHDWILVPQRQAGSQVQVGQRFALRNNIWWDFLVYCPERAYFDPQDLRVLQRCP